MNGYRWIWLLFLIMLPLESQAQPFVYYQPRVFASASAGLFRISLDDFEDVYTDRWGLSYGGAAGVRVYSTYYVIGKVREFKKGGKSGSAPGTGLSLSDARWEERWYNVGVRVHPPITDRFSSFYGFGMVFYDIDEHADTSVFREEGDDEVGNGLYLELGIEYFFHRKISSWFETEISSGGVRGRTGYEAFSVGGFRFALGLSVYPF